MSISLARAVAAGAAAAAALAGCSTPATPTPEPTSDTGTASTTSRPTAQATTPGSPTVRTRSEQAFVNELSRLGLPTHSAAGTTIEVGIGICRSLAEGEQTDVILDRIRPLTSVLAAQHSERDTDEVGRSLVDASRSHLCG